MGLENNLQINYRSRFNEPIGVLGLTIAGRAVHTSKTFPSTE